jgi:hypothetical protein
MAKKKQKYLIETSAVLATLGHTSAGQKAAVALATNGEACATTIYVRKEFIAFYILPIVRFAFEVSQFENVGDALVVLSQQFSPRNLKTYLLAIANILRKHGQLKNSFEASEDIARIAIHTMRAFDSQLARVAQNSCKCSIGAKPLLIDYDQLHDDLRVFIRSQDNVDDCEINDVLRFHSDKQSEAKKLLVIAGVAQTAAGAKASSFGDAKKWISCRECKQIGDFVIALDHPKGYCLVHTDSAFDVLCAATGRSHVKIPSVQAAGKQSPSSHSGT